MDSAPLSHPDPVPADIDFEVLREVSTIPIDSVETDDESLIVEGEDRSAWSEADKRYPSLRKLRGMQRVLSDVVLSVSTEPKDKAACARAWRDLEILRYAKQGKPLALNATMRVEPKARSSSAPLAIVEVDQSSAA